MGVNYHFKKDKAGRRSKMNQSTWLVVLCFWRECSAGIVAGTNDGTVLSIPVSKRLLPKFLFLQVDDTENQHEGAKVRASSRFWWRGDRNDRPKGKFLFAMTRRMTRRSSLGRY